jgi:hypothetical protein
MAAAEVKRPTAETYRAVIAQESGALVYLVCHGRRADGVYLSRLIGLAEHDSIALPDADIEYLPTEEGVQPRVHSILTNSSRDKGEARRNGLNVKEELT